MDKKIIKIALAGNPNSGKTSVFNFLCREKQHTGNWPGVTVEKKEGKVFYKDYEFIITDLPGIYSISTYSIEEIVARDFILDEKPDVVINVVDATVLDRSLYLTTQLIELKAKLVIAFNMYDEVEKSGLEIDTEKLSGLLGAKIVKTIAVKNYGLYELLDEAINIYEGKSKYYRHIHLDYGHTIMNEMFKIQALLKREEEIVKRYSTRFIALKLLEEDDNIIDKVKKFSSNFNEIESTYKKSIELIKSIMHDDPKIILTERIYGFISGVIHSTIRKKKADRISISENVDKIVTSKILGIPIFLLILYITFVLTFSIGNYIADLIDLGIGFLSDWLKNFMRPGVLTDLITDGIIGGVGGVLVFTPNIFILFFVLSFLEDIGYMARGAFVADKIMAKIGLHGKAFIPMIMGFGCNVPAIMSTRTLESKEDRFVSILVNPLISCSARLPIYILIISIFFKKNASLVLFSIYLISILLAATFAKIFKSTIFKSPALPFVMELPPYRLPTLRSLMLHTWEKGSEFLKKMGTIILAGSILIWFLSAYPFDSGNNVSTKGLSNLDKTNIQSISNNQNSDNQINKKNDNLLDANKNANNNTNDKINELDTKNDEKLIERIGKFIAPVFKPLSFSWRETVAILSGFIAKEVVASSINILYDDDNLSVADAVKKYSGMTPVSAFAFLLFILVYTPCLATIVTIYKETKSASLTLFSLGYQITLAYTLAFLVIKIGNLFL